MMQKGAESVLACPLPPVPPPGPLMLLPPPTGMPPGPSAPVALLPAIPTCGDRARLQLGWNALAMVHLLVNREITLKFAAEVQPGRRQIVSAGANAVSPSRYAELITYPKYVICAERPKRRAGFSYFQ